MNTNVMLTLGAWLYPETSSPRKSESEVRLQLRAGIIGALCICTAIAAVALGLWNLSTQLLGIKLLAMAVALIAFSVFAPQAIFRTRNAARARELLNNPSTPIQPWHATTITFDAVLVGGMLAGLYLEPWLTLDLFALALVIKLVSSTHYRLLTDPNARFHMLTEAWMAAAVALAAYVIVHPLAANVQYDRSILPMVLAGLVAMVLGLAFNGVQRWISVTRQPWALLRDATDSRRIVVALISAGLAWLVAWADAQVRNMSGSSTDLAVEFTSLGVFIAGWLVLWYVSIWMWRRDAKRTLALWAEHQAQIVVRLAGGSLSPDLAGRAALPTVARMAISIFSATRAMAAVDLGGGKVSTYLVARDRYDNAPQADASALNAYPHLHLHCYPSPGELNLTGVTIASWLWPGWFLTRSHDIVSQFTNIAALTLLTPIVAENEGTADKSFDLMFDAIHRWPTLAAFNQAVDRMRARADANPHSDSLVVAVFAIDEFGALNGGRFEQAAVAQVARITLGHEEFAGHDAFVAYQAPGRIWVALAGGPIVRNGIALLRGLQTRINDQGSVPAHRLDVDVHVSVSLGYGAHQVDDFTREGLMATALNRLAIDASTRSPFLVDSMITYDIRPEDIIGEPEMPLTAVDVLNQLSHESDPLAYCLEIHAVAETDSGTAQALMIGIGWDRVIGNVDLSRPEDFAMLVNRQPELAAAATRIAVDRLLEVIDATDAYGSTALPIMVTLPPTLLDPEVGHLSLPNLVSPRLDRKQSARTVIVFDKIPRGSSQALRVLADRGLSIAVTAGAAAEADPVDLVGWNRWAILFPRDLLQGTSGIDGLTIQQTVSAIAGHGTRLIGQVDHYADSRELAKHNIKWTVHPDEVSKDVSTALQRCQPVVADIG